MDVFSVFLGVFKSLWWVLPILAILGFLKTPKAKGMIGELFVNLSAKSQLPEDIYHPIHNVTLPTKDGTTQIDHIFVSKYGVFVVETKNMKGWIFGSEKQASWTQQIYKVKNKFQNPLRQNYKHVKTLEAVLDIPSETIKSIVAFTGASTFKTSMPANVTQGTGYIHYIKSFSDKEILDDDQVQSVIKKIQSGRLQPSRTTDKEHVKHLKSRSDPNASRDCPKCGKSMVLRTAKKGDKVGKQFWGCSGFPSCRVVQQIK